MAQVATDLTKGTGRFSHSSPVTAKNLRIFGSIYLLSMILRYIIRMYIYPEERWTGGCMGNLNKVSEELETEEK